MYTSLCSMYLNVYAAKRSEAFVNRSNTLQREREKL